MVNKIFQNCKKISGWIKKNHLQYLMNPHLTGYSNIRFYSIIDMFDSFYQNFGKIKTILIEKKKSCIIFNKADLYTLIELLKPFKLAIVKLEAEKTPTIQLVIPVAYMLLNHCETAKIKNNKLKLKIKKLIREKFVIDLITDIHWAAIIITPVSRDLKYTSINKNWDLGLSFLKHFIYLCKQEDLKNPKLKKARLSIIVDNKNMDIYGYPNNHSVHKQQNQNPENIEINRYFKMVIKDNVEYRINPLMFWKENKQKFKYLSKIAKSIFVCKLVRVLRREYLVPDAYYKPH
jgi:hypothetical protein